MKLEEPLAKRYLPEYMIEAVNILEDSFHLKPSMGEKMLVRRYMEEACQELTGLEICSRDYFRLADEAIARFFCLHYHISASDDLLDAIVKGHPASSNLLQRIKAIRGETK